MPRTFKQIAKDIKSIWLNTYYLAEGFLDILIKEDTSDPMARCTSPGMGSFTVGQIAELFLRYAKSFRGKDARALKAELRSLLNKKENDGAIRLGYY